MPPQMTHSLFENLQTLGTGLAHNGCLDPEILARIASPERYPTYLWPFFQVFLRLSISHSYFDGMLKQNGLTIGALPGRLRKKKLTTGRNDEAIQDLNDFISYAQNFSYTGPEVTDAKARLKKLQP